MQLLQRMFALFLVSWTSDQKLIVETVFGVTYIYVIYAECHIILLNQLHFSDFL